MIRITKETPLKVVIELGKECSRCNNCCSFDTGIVLEEDIPKMAKHLNMSEDKFRKNYLVEHEKFNKRCFKFKQEKKEDKESKIVKPYGRCIMLDEKKGCIIHDVKPLHCRVCSVKSEHGQELVQWFALNYLVDASDPESIRQWSVFLQYNKPISGGELDKLVPDETKLKKILNYDLLK
ncbi:MAG: YkgJ family cysteine cluster protein [Candidatus Woesearchaeota archaeon]